MSEYFCKNCNHPIKETDLFCSQCGTKIETDSFTVQKQSFIVDRKTHPVLKDICSVCGIKLPKHFRTELPEGYICTSCARLCTRSNLVSIEQLSTVWSENQQRFKSFVANMVVTELGRGYIYIDTQHNWAYISQKKIPNINPIVFSFSEIEDYRIENVGEKVVTKTKGGIGRALVGGAVFGAAGAIVGATTAKTETKTTGGIATLYIDLNLQGIKTTISMAYPPSTTMATLESMRG